ncbi:unnamed protein product [Toxocara canis]|uniref:Ovule protein n=1 Tax=Toxocara canis TaxID=6265 RepID=A0A183VA92_TOXCA|nr:unnamed protein product [Toxocara canis]
MKWRISLVAKEQLFCLGSSYHCDQKEQPHALTLKYMRHPLVYKHCNAVAFLSVNLVPGHHIRQIAYIDFKVNLQQNMI